MAVSAMAAIMPDMKMLPQHILLSVLASFDMQTLRSFSESGMEMHNLIDDYKLDILRQKSATVHSPELHEFIMENFTVYTMDDFWIVLRIVEYEDDYKESSIIEFGPTRIKLCRLISEYDLLPHMFQYLCTEYGQRISLHRLMDRQLLANYRFMIDNNIHDIRHTGGRHYCESIISWVLNYNRAYQEVIVHLIQGGLTVQTFMGCLRSMYNTRHIQGYIPNNLAQLRDLYSQTAMADTVQTRGRIPIILERAGFDIERLSVE